MKKVYELAKEIGITPLELVDVLKKYKIPVKSHMSVITEDQESDLHFMIKQELDEKEKLEKAQAKSKEDYLKNGPAKAAKVAKVHPTCIKCKSDKIALINGRCKDMFSIQMKDFEYDGYVLHNINIGGGDDIDFSYCLACGQMQGKFPIDLGKALQGTDDDESND